MAESNADKKHAPSAQRLREARRRGEVPHAADTVAASGVAALVIVLVAIGPTAFERFGGLLEHLLLLVRHRPGVDATGIALRLVAQELMPFVLPIVLVPALAALLAAFVVSGPVMSFVPLMPRLERLNPAEGLKRVVSVQGLFNVAKGLLTVGVLLLTGAGLLLAWPKLLVAFWRATPEAMLASLSVLLATLVGTLVLVALVLSLPDLMFQRWQFKRQQRMDDTELRRESRDQDGDPQQRGERRRIHGELVRKG
jgi:type III secretion protein U